MCRTTIPGHGTGLPFCYKAYEAVPADLDSDGDLDVVATGWGKPAA